MTELKGLAKAVKEHIKPNRQTLSLPLSRSLYPAALPLCVTQFNKTAYSLLFIFIIEAFSAMVSLPTMFACVCCEKT